MTRRQRRELERERQAQLQRENARELLSQAPDDSGLSGRANAAYGGGGYNDAGYNGSYNGGYGSGAPASAASAPSTFSAAASFTSGTAASAPSAASTFGASPFAGGAPDAAASFGPGPFAGGTVASAPSAPSSFAMPASAASAPSAFGAPATAASAPSTFSAAASAASAPSSFAGTAWSGGQPGAVQPGVAQSNLGQAATGQPGAAHPGAVQNPVDDGVDYQPTQIISAIKDEIIDDVAIRNWSAAASAKVAKAADAVSTASVISTASVASAASVTSAVSAHTAASAAGAQGLNIAAQATSAAANSANLTPQAPLAQVDQTPARGNPLEVSNPVETNSLSEPSRLGCGTTPPVKRKGAAARRRAAFARVGQICAVSALALVTIVAPVSAAMMGADSPLNTALGAHRGQSSRQVISGKDSVAGSVDHSPLESSDVKLRNVPDAATKARIRAAYENPVVTCAPQQGASGDTTAFNTTPDVFKPMVAGTYTLSSPWGYRIHPVLGTSKMHAGQDMAAPAGTPIYAAAAGEVVEAGMVDSTGTVTIKHELDGKIWYTSYLHMYQDGIFVKKGQQVKAGQLIAAVGSTGYSTGPHLHFEVRIKNDTADASTVDPMKWLSDHKAVELSTDCKSSGDSSTPSTGDGSGTGDGSTGTTDGGSSDGTATGGGTGTGDNSAGLNDNSNGSTGTSDSGTGTNDSGTGTNGGNTGTNGGTGANGNTGTSEGNIGESNSDGSTSGGN